MSKFCQAEATRTPSHQLIGLRKEFLPAVTRITAANCSVAEHSHVSFSAEGLMLQKSLGSIAIVVFLL